MKPTINVDTRTGIIYITDGQHQNIRHDVTYKSTFLAAERVYKEGGEIHITDGLTSYKITVTKTRG